MYQDLLYPKQKKAVAPKPCSFCAIGAAQGRSSCFGCGQKIILGRQPTIEEIKRSEIESLPAKPQSLSVGESQGRIDAIILSVIEDRLMPLCDFTHDNISDLADLNVSTVKFSLNRLADRGIVVRAGWINLRRERRREVWQYIPCELRGLYQAFDKDRHDLQLDQIGSLVTMHDATERKTITGTVMPVHILGMVNGRTSSQNMLSGEIVNKKSFVDQDEDEDVDVKESKSSKVESISRNDEDDDYSDLVDNGPIKVNLLGR